MICGHLGFLQYCVFVSDFQCLDLSARQIQEWGPFAAQGRLVSGRFRPDAVTAPPVERPRLWRSLQLRTWLPARKEQHARADGNGLSQSVV